MNIADPVITAEDLIKQAAAKAEEGDYVGAVQGYNQAILIDPNNAKAYGNRGLVRATLGDRRSAIADCYNAARLFLAQGSIANYEMLLGYIKKIEQQ